MVKRLVLVTAVFLLSVPVQAKRKNADLSVIKSVEKLSSQAAVNFDQGNYEKAFELYSRAHEKMPDPRLTFAMVRCMESLHRYKEALDLINQGLTENPDKVLKDRFLSKKRFLTSKLKTGHLQLLVNPSGTTVEIDGKVVGQSPIDTIDISNGTHTLKLSHPGYADLVQGIHVNGGNTLKLSIKLSPISGSLTVLSTPSGANVLIDGKARAVTPARNISLQLGTHQVAITKPGYATVTRQVNISPTKTSTIDIILSTTAERNAVQEGPWYKSWPGWVTLALGIGLGVGGGVLMYQADQDHSHVDWAVSHPNQTKESQWNLNNTWENANKKQKIGIGLVAGAGAVTITSIILFATKVGVPNKRADGKVSIVPIANSRMQGLGFTYDF